jgi:hypothetical protein
VRTPEAQQAADAEDAETRALEKVLAIMTPLTREQRDRIMRTLAVWYANDGR